MRRVSSHTHVQTIPSTIWDIQHGLYCNPILSVKVFDNGALTVILPSKVEFLSNTNVKITFTSPRAGEARLS